VADEPRDPHEPHEPDEPHAPRDPAAAAGPAEASGTDASAEPGARLTDAEEPVRPVAGIPPQAAAGATAARPAAGVDEDAARRARHARRVDRYAIPGLAVLLALAVGALVIVFSNPDLLSSWSGFFNHPLDTLRASWDTVEQSYRALLEGAVGSPIEIAKAVGSGNLDEIEASLRPLSEMIVVTTPLILAGLSVAIGFQAGLFNIGAEGQITVGAMFAAFAGFSMSGWPGPVVVVAVVVAGFVGGALWGGIPGLLKAKTGAHEVITTIMLNFVSYRLLDYALASTVFQRPGRQDPISKPVVAAFPTLFGSSLRVHWGIVLAIAVAIGVAFVLNRTTTGFQFRAVGLNPNAARAAGISPTRNYVVVMGMAGGLAGLVGANQLLSTGPSLTPGFSSGFGFDAIALAMLGRSRPAGVVAAAFLFGILRAGSRSMQAATDTPIDIVTVIQALVIVFVAAPSIVRAVFRIKTPTTSAFQLTRAAA
jgi:general nucleoside transport system permease protein